MPTGKFSSLSGAGYCLPFCLWWGWGMLIFGAKATHSGCYLDMNRPEGSGMMYLKKLTGRTQIRSLVKEGRLSRTSCWQWCKKADFPEPLVSSGRRQTSQNLLSTASHVLPTHPVSHLSSLEYLVTRHPPQLSTADHGHVNVGFGWLERPSLPVTFLHWLLIWCLTFGKSSAEGIRRTNSNVRNKKSSLCGLFQVASSTTVSAFLFIK